MWVKEQAISVFTTDKSPGIIIICNKAQAGQSTSHQSFSFGRDCFKKGRRTHQSTRILDFCPLPNSRRPQACKLYCLEYWPLIVSGILDLKLQEAHNEKPEIQLQNELQRKQETYPARTNLPISGNSFFNYFAAHSQHGKALHYIKGEGTGEGRKRNTLKKKKSDYSCQLGQNKALQECKNVLAMTGCQITPSQVRDQQQNHLAPLIIIYMFLTSLHQQKINLFNSAFYILGTLQHLRSFQAVKCFYYSAFTPNTEACIEIQLDVQQGIDTL